MKDIDLPSINLTILETFEYLRRYPKRALLPFHHMFGAGKKIDQDLYKILLLIGLADKNEDDDDTDAATIPAIANRFEENFNIAHLLNELLTIFSYYALHRNNHAVLKRFKKHLKRFAETCGYEVHIINVAKMAQQKVLLDEVTNERLRREKKPTRPTYSYQIWYDSFTPHSYKRIQQSGSARNFKKISEEIDPSLKDHSSFFVLQPGDLVYQRSKALNRRQKKLKKRHEWALLGLAMSLGSIAVIGDAVGSLFMSGISDVAFAGLFFTGFYIVVGLPIMVYGAYQSMKLLFSGDFFKNLDGSDMSKKQLFVVGIIFGLCLAAALINGLMVISALTLSAPYLAGVLAAFTVACATLASWELCAEIYRVGVATSLKKFWQRTFDSRLPLSKRIMRGIGLVLAVALVVGILAVSMSYSFGLIGAVFLGLHLAPAVATTITSVLLALAAPVMTFQYTYYATRAMMGLMDAAHALGTGIGYVATKVIAPAVKKAAEFIAEKTSKLFTFCKNALFSPRKAAPEPKPIVVAVEKPAPTYQETKDADFQKSKQSMKFFFQLQKFRASAANFIMQFCQGAAAFYNQGASSHPNCLAVTRGVNIPDAVGTNLIAGLATLDVLTSASPSIDETATNATYTHELNPSPQSSDLKSHMEWTPSFFKDLPAPIQHPNGYLLESNPTLRL